MIDNEILDSIWKKATVVPGYSPSILRLDACGAWIMLSEYGNESSPFGWVVDHIFPIILGGDDQVDNLRPMQWENCLAKGNDYPYYKSVIVANGNENIRRERQLVVKKTTQEKLSILYSK